MSSEIFCKALQSLDRRERQRALNDLLEYCLSPDHSADEIISTYDQTNLYILKCYSDKYESCRELATDVITEFFRKLPANDYYLQYVVSTLAGRIGQKETFEKSEELRLQFLYQLDFLIDKYRENDGRDLLLKSYNEVIDILVKELRDKYPAAQRKACHCIRTLAEATPSFHYRAEALVAPLIAMLHHKHSTNRVDAIELLGIVALHITSNGEMISQIITEISPLLMDSMPRVRQECGRAGCKMLMDLRDRYSFFPRILPLVLCCLNDECPDVRDEIHALWIKCGDQYYEENENELNKKEIVDDCPSRYPDGIKRPTLGCREIVQRSLKMVPLILKEVTDWKEEVRLHALKLFWQVVLHAEELLTVQILDIFPVMSRVCADAEKEVAREAVKCSELMGMLMVYKDWFECCLDSIKENPKLGYLKCFYSLFAAAINFSSKEDVRAVALVLHERDFSHSLQFEFQSYLLKFVDILSMKNTNELEISEALETLSLSGDKRTEEFLYHVIIKVMALSYGMNDKSLQKEGHELLVKLAEGDERLVCELHAKHMNSVLETFDCLDADNDGNSEPILLLHGIICICGFQKSYLENLKQCVCTVWEHGTPDGKVKVFSAISIAMMTWSATISTEFEESLSLLQDFINAIVVPQLVWKAGASAESLRALGTATLCSMALGAPEEAPAVLCDLVPQLSTLIEDNSATTRVYALRSLIGIGPIKLNELRTLGYAVLQRLDDPSSEVRDWAARSIVKIRVDENTLESVQLDIRNKFLNDIFAMLFLHLDGPEVRLTKTIKKSIIELGNRHGDVFRDAFSKACLTVCAKDEMNEIKSLTLH